MKIQWLEIQNIKYKEVFDEITKLEKQNIVFTPNPEIIIEASKDIKFKNDLQKASFLTSDWIWLYIAYQIIDNSYGKIINFFLLPYFFFNLFFRRKNLYKKYGERICGSDLTKDLVLWAQENNIKISIIDLYNPNDIKKVKSQKDFIKNVWEKFPKLNFDFYIYNPEKKEEIIEKIKSSNSQILFSTLWMKKQEKSVIEIMERNENIKIWLWIWSSFDYFIWFQKRAPQIWRKLWLEWLYRLVTWPQKINRLKRIFNAIFVFNYMILKNKWWKKIQTGV